MGLRRPSVSLFGPNQHQRWRFGIIFLSSCYEMSLCRVETIEKDWRTLLFFFPGACRYIYPSRLDGRLVMNQEKNSVNFHITFPGQIDQRFYLCKMYEYINQNESFHLLMYLLFFFGLLYVQSSRMHGKKAQR